MLFLGVQKVKSQTGIFPTTMETWPYWIFFENDLSRFLFVRGKTCKNKKCRVQNFQHFFLQAELSVVRSQIDRGRQSFQKSVFPHFYF